MFKQKTIRSLKKARKEIEQLKSSTTEWILFLRKTDLELLERVMIIEARLKEIESKLD